MLSLNMYIFLCKDLNIYIQNMFSYVKIVSMKICCFSSVGGTREKRFLSKYDAYKMKITEYVLKYTMQIADLKHKIRPF